MKSFKLFTVFAALFVTFLFTANSSAQTWTLQTSPVSTDLNGSWACDANVVWACGPTGVVIRTTNGGATWALANTGLAGNDFYCISAVDANTCIAGAGDGGLWRTTNGGTSWTFILLPGTPVFLDVVHFFDANNGFAMSDPGGSPLKWGYWITTNGGATWSAGANAPSAVGTEAGWNGSYCAIDTGHIWWGTNVTKIYKGGFRGAFTSGPTSQPNQFGIQMNDALIGACVQNTAANAVAANGITVNGGVLWTANAFTPATISFSMKGIPGSGYMWMGCTSQIYVSSNAGVTWTQQFALTNAGYSLTFANVNTGWCTTALGKIYKYAGTVGINTNNNTTPTKFTLEQNYPNPFNPTTNINFSVPSSSNVSIKIYNSLGKEVMTVINGYKTTGNYSENIDMSNLGSGVYF